MVGGHCIYLYQILKLLFAGYVFSSLAIKSIKSVICVLIRVFYDKPFLWKCKTPVHSTRKGVLYIPMNRYAKVQHGESMRFMGLLAIVCVRDYLEEQK